MTYQMCQVDFSQLQDISLRLHLFLRSWRVRLGGGRLVMSGHGLLLGVTIRQQRQTIQVISKAPPPKKNRTWFQPYFDSISN